MLRVLRRAGMEHPGLITRRAELRKNGEKVTGEILAEQLIKF
jgi:hypothetical protein